MNKLNGTEKQIIWANDIIEKSVSALDSVVDYWKDHEDDDYMNGVVTEIQTGIDKLMSVIENVEDASYIIEHRNDLSQRQMKINLASVVETERAKKAVSMLIR